MINRYPVSKVIGRKITYYRKMKGISLDELASLIGVSQQQQSRYERGLIELAWIDLINMQRYLISI